MAYSVEAPIQTLLSENFSDNHQLDPAKWSYNVYSAVNNPSYYGRTQQQQSLPVVSGGVLHLTLQTYDPTGPGNAFVGSEVISKQLFNTSTGGIEFTAVARLVNPVAGVVGGIFGYSFNSTSNLDNELDFELLSNVAVGQNNQAETNIYGNQALGAGNPLSVNAPSLTTFQTYTMEWFPNEVLWFIDGQLVRETDANIPLGSLAYHLNFWAPDTTWAAAYSAMLHPASTQSANTTYEFDVQSLNVARIAAPAEDFSGAALSDIAWRNTNGEFGVWLTTSAGGYTPVDLGHVDTSWAVQAVGDFNGDGKADILWRNANGELGEWLSNSGVGFQNFTKVDLGPVAASWVIQSAADFNGDGSADILWRNTSGELGLWFTGASGGPPTELDLGAVDNSWTVDGVGDFNGDGKADILWRNTNGEVGAWVSTPGTGFQGFSKVDLGFVPTSWVVQGVGDFNGDGASDILWRNANGDVGIWFSSGGGFTTLDLGVVDASWSITGVRDFNGDGKADILWRNTDGQVGEWLMNSGAGYTGYTAVILAMIDPSWTVVADRPPALGGTTLPPGNLLMTQAMAALGAGAGGSSAAPMLAAPSPLQTVIAAPSTPRV